MSREELVSQIIDAGLTMPFMEVFGWQGGTVHQVADELISLSRADEDVTATLKVLQAEKFMRELAG